MTVNSFFHNSVNGDRTYEANDFATHTGTIISDGVVEGLKVTYTSAFAYTIDVGKAIVMGRSVFNDAVIATSIGTPVSGDLYSVVVRMDLTSRAASIETILGTTYQDDNAIKQIPLATILVGANTLTITDKRNFVAYKSNKISIQNSALKFKTTAGTNFDSITFKEGSDQTGVGMAIGAGGTTLIGGGESALYTLDITDLVPDTITEKLILTSDYHVEVWTGLQDVKTNSTVGKRFIFNSNGDFNIGGSNVDLMTCTFRYTTSSKILEVFHWSGTAASDTVLLAVGDIAFQNTPWLNLTLQGGAVKYSATTTPQYKKKGGVVYIKGAITNLTSPTVTIATLPDGYRPRGTSHNYAMPTTGSQFARWAINTDGTIKLEAVNTTIAAGDWFPINTCFDAD